MRKVKHVEALNMLKQYIIDLVNNIMYVSYNLSLDMTSTILLKESHNRSLSYPKKVTLPSSLSYDILETRVLLLLD